LEGVSASKQRAFVSKNDFVGFSQGVPKSMKTKDVKKLFNDIRKGMGLKEERTPRNHVDLGKNCDIREKYLKGELFDIGERVVIKKEQTEGTISFLGSNYLIVETDEGQKHRQWLDGVEKLTTKTFSASVSSSLDSRTMRYLDKIINGDKYKRALKVALDIRRSPEHKGLSIERVLDKTAKVCQLDYRNLLSMYSKMKKSKVLPAGLSENVDHVFNAKEKIEKEKKADKLKHDRMMKRATLRKAITSRKRSTPRDVRNIKK